jgi:nicotinamide riboside transporter PnuC
MYESEIAWHSITTGITMICLIGTYLNVKKSVWCFYLWIAGNVAWFSIDIALGIYSRAFLDIVQLAFAIWGAWEWRSRKNTA